MSAANMQNRLSKIEAQSSPSRVHVIVAGAVGQDGAIDAYGRDQIAPRDLVVVIRRLADDC